MSLASCVQLSRYSHVRNSPGEKHNHILFDECLNKGVADSIQEAVTEARVQHMSCSVVDNNACSGNQTDSKAIANPLSFGTSANGLGFDFVRICSTEFALLCPAPAESTV